MTGAWLSHSVGIFFSHLSQLAMEVDVNREVEISDVPLIWLHLEDSIDLLPLLAGEVVLEVEHSLLPVGVGGLWSRGETNSLVALRELDVEKCHESLNVVVPLDLEMEGRLEGNVSLGAGLNVNFLE